MALTGSARVTNELQGSVESGGEVRGKLSGLEFIQGKSAYEVAVINGFRGTEEEWLESLKGEPGKTGPTGPQGEPGFVQFEELTDEQKEMLRGYPGKDGRDGKDGYTPVKGVDYFDGQDGKNGQDGKAGATIVSLVRTSGTGAAGTTDTYTITLSDGTAHSFHVYNGADGQGAGDMLKSVYDPQNKNTDIFSYVEQLLQRAAVAKIGTVTLLASAWVGSGSLYSQVVTIDGVTERSQVDLTPDVEQLVIFYEKDLTFVTENDGGIVTVYAIGQKPTNDYTIQVTITEVSV